VWDKLVFTFVCIALPVVWGVVVNWLFDLWRGQPDTQDDDRVFPDYQI